MLPEGYTTCVRSSASSQPFKSIPRDSLGKNGTSSCVWNPRVFADDARGWQCPFVLCLHPQGYLRPPQLEKNHVVPTAWQDEALARDGVSREVPCSALKELSRVFSNTTVQKHQFFCTQLSSQSNSHIHT